MLKMLNDYRRRRAERRIADATATVKALATGGTNYYARSVDRLFLDGGSAEGFAVAAKLGWAQYVKPPGMGRERFGRLTPLGMQVAIAASVNRPVTIDAKAA